MNGPDSSRYEFRGPAELGFHLWNRNLNGSFPHFPSEGGFSVCVQTLSTDTGVGEGKPGKGKPAQFLCKTRTHLTLDIFPENRHMIWVFIKK